MDQHTITPAPGITAVSVVIVSYRRGAILLETLRHVKALSPAPAEVIVVDQTEAHPGEVRAELERIERGGSIRRIVLPAPSIPDAMNAGLQAAGQGTVLYLDDDVVPDGLIVAGHERAHRDHPDAWAVVGKVIQPEDPQLRERAGRRRRIASPLREDLDFYFGSDKPAWIANLIACHCSVKRDNALAVGGFDDRFVPPVSFRFETEFAKRLIAAGGRIYFDPSIVVRHLRAGTGGTRAQGRHLTSASPLHGVGDYYYALKHGKGWDRTRYIIRRPFREVRTRFHLRHPWWIPVKFVGELRAIWAALRLYRQGPKLL